jgi:hypothetical protein
MEVYVNTAVETDGPIPGPHSMLRFASTAFGVDGRPLDVFAATLAPLAGASVDPESMAWRAEHSEAWRSAKGGPRNPAEVMPEYVAWLRRLPGQPVFVGTPAGVGLVFVYWYLIRFAGERPASTAGQDVRSYATAVLGAEFRTANRGPADGPAPPPPAAPPGLARTRRPGRFRPERPAAPDHGPTNGADATHREMRAFAETGRPHPSVIAGREAAAAETR